MNETTGELRISCGCKIIVKPMSKSYVRCDTHKDEPIDNLKQMFTAAHHSANRFKYNFNPRKLLGF